MAILKSVLGWIYRHFLTFLIIVALLVSVKAVLNQFEDIGKVDKQIRLLEAADTELQTFYDNQKSETIKRINAAKKAVVSELDERTIAIDSEISRHKKRQCNRLKRFTNIKKCLVLEAESEIRIALLEQERPYVVQLRDNAIKVDDIAKNQREIEEAKRNKSQCNDHLKDLETLMLTAKMKLDENREKQRKLKADCGNNIKQPWERCYKELKKLKKEEDRLSDTYDNESQIYQTKKKVCDEIAIPIFVPQEISEIVIKIEVEIENILAPLRKVQSELQKVQSTHWLKKLALSIRAVIPMALMMVASIIFTPFVIKVLLYSFVAPAASRRTSHRLIPETSGSIGHFYDLAKTIDVDSEDELLIHPDYVLFTPETASKNTKWLLDNRYPLSSLASGMYALTRFRHDSMGVYGIAPTKNPLSKLAVLEIPAGSAFVLHPRCLIGVVQRRGHPVAITSHWRVGSIHAWLTLQLRYLVFHGPVTVIVEGCGGVSIEKAGQGRSVNQAAMIGFSANLPYATTRAEPFAAYLMGKQELFNDNFPSGPGYFIYENTPLFGKKTGIVFGRGPEGIVDSFLKVFGV